MGWLQFRRLVAVVALLAPCAPAGARAADEHGAPTAAVTTLDGAEYAVPAKGDLVTGFGPLRLVVGAMVPAPSTVQAEEAVRYRLRRSIERFGRRAEEPLTWDDGMAQATFRLDRHRSDPKLATGAVYAIDSDLLVDAGQVVSLALRLNPPSGSGEIAYAVRADIGGLRFLEQEGTLQGGGKPVELPISFIVRGLCDLPVTISVAAGGLDANSGAVAEQVELVLLDTSPGHDPAPVTSSRATSAADSIVRPVLTPTVVPGAEPAAGEGGEGKDKKDKKEKGEKKDKEKKKEKKEE